ncbi:hypothetical protein [Azospirillum sp.]|uniref:hypothetical protein n=1 Tax=Azospirillum sp. TaxID=34012 RepID=UPI003D751012
MALTTEGVLGSAIVKTVKGLNAIQSLQVEAGEAPVGIGPVISGWDSNVPVYYVDLVFADGSVQRLMWRKSTKGLDKKAKGNAIFERMKLAERFRGDNVVLTHDLVSFNGLVTWVSRFTQGVGGQGFNG